ncbi:MAG: hypothetical protein WCB67_06745 [Solirubrobacteraceae bacterium]
MRRPAVPSGVPAARDRATHAVGRLRTEPFWQGQAALLGAVILYLSLPGKFVVGPVWLMPVLELLLIGGLWLDRPREERRNERRERAIAVGLLALVAASNLLSLELLVHDLLKGGLKAGGHQLILSAVVIWLTNVVVFALWFWEIDRGGPDRRARDPDAPADFWFPHMSEPASHPGWAPNFVDYLYLSYTNSTALSPTDTMPMTTRVKLLMMGQSITSLITVLLVASRAVNILH